MPDAADFPADPEENVKAGAIAVPYGVSEDLVTFRIRMTGVYFQLRAARRSK